MIWPRSIAEINDLSLGNDREWRGRGSEDDERASESPSSLRAVFARSATGFGFEDIASPCRQIRAQEARTSLTLLCSQEVDMHRYRQG